MTNSIPETEIPDETLNPNTEQCPLREPPPNLDHQSPQTLTPIPHSPNPNQYQDSTMQDTIPTLTLVDDDDDPEPDAPTGAAGGGGGGGTIKRTTKRKKMGPKRTALERKAREKLQVLVETLKPIPFTPAKSLDFEKHQSLLQRLGLWDFVHIEFDTALRGDLLAQLVASYLSTNRCSYVNGVRIQVNRADLGRALKLPVKKIAGGTPAAVSIDDSAESIAFVQEVVYTWMLLHDDDAYIMPNDVLGFLSLIKDGNFEKVDWAGLIWCMVDKELKSPQLESCYYASHLQHLIRAQHAELFEEEEGVEVVEEENDVKEEGEEEEDEEEDEGLKEEIDASGDVKMGEVDELQVQELEEHRIELSLGQDNNVERVEVENEKEQGVEEQMMVAAFEQSKEEEEEEVEMPGMWLLDPKNSVEEQFLRPCHGGDVKGFECEQVREDEDEGEGVQEQDEVEDEEEEEDPEEDEHESGFHLSPKCIPMEGMTSGNGGLIQAMEAGQMPFGSGIDLRDTPVGDFLTSREDEPQMISSSSLFGNGHNKRDNLVLDNHHSLNGSNKRLRGDSPWNSKPMDFETCVEQMEHWMGKARMMYATKDQACEESTMNQQLLINELQKRDNMIEHLHKSKMEDTQKRQIEVYRFEKELYMMQSLVDGYRKALKETRKAFAEYRERCPQGDEPLYKELPGSGGLVLTVVEVERERLKKEAEERAKLRDFMIEFEKKTKDFESTWFGKFEAHNSTVESLSKRLLVLEDQVKHLNEVNANRKVSDPIECKDSDPIECEVSGPIECKDSDPIECEVSDPIECKDFDPIECEVSDPIECKDSDPIECEASDPIECKALDPIECKASDPIECAPTTEGETA